MVALRLGRVNNCVVTLHSPYETIDIGSTRARWWASSSRRSFSAVVSPSEHGSRFQRNCGVNAEQVVTIRNAIDPTAIEAANADRVRSEMKMTGGEPMIVFTSRIEPQKRPVDAVRIFAGVSDEFPDARLVFVGSGSARDAVAAAAEQLGLLDRVMLVGLRSDVPDWLAAATVWLLPTERENFSVAVLEALAAGCPILTTNCPGNDEVIVNGENAISFEPGDVPAATDGLRRLILDATFRQRLSRGAVKSSRDYFMDTMVDQYLALYEHAEPSR
jgi:glycosyltransferase involved in cell wall biosynthesis